jgi:hypothetical protein
MLTSYSEYAMSVKACLVAASRLAARYDLPSGHNSISLEDGLELLEKAESRRTEAWELVLLLGASDTIDAAREWQQTAWKIEDFGRGSRSGLDAYLEARKQSEQARERFYECARRDIEARGRNGMD